MWYGISVDTTWPTRHKTVKAMPVQRRSTIDDTEPTLKRLRFNTLRLLGKECNFAVGSALVDNRRSWTNAKVTRIHHPAPAVGIMSGNCRKDVQTPNQDMVQPSCVLPSIHNTPKRDAGSVLASVCSAGQTPTQQRARVLCMPATSILFIIVTLNIIFVKYCYYIIQI